MAYFHNGTQMLDYYDRVCVRCIHAPKVYIDGPECPVWGAHLGREDGDERVLDQLIPNTERGIGDCRMFVERAK